MTSRKERNVSGKFIAVVDGDVVGPFTGREPAIKAAKALMSQEQYKDMDADIYHRVCEVKARNIAIKETLEELNAAEPLPLVETS